MLVVDVVPGDGNVKNDKRSVPGVTHMYERNGLIKTMNAFLQGLVTDSKI